MKKGPNVWRRLGGLERAFLLCVCLYLTLALFHLASGIQGLTGVAAVILGLIALFRAARSFMKKAIWRLRNRLIAAYLFIAVVPVVLITALLCLAGYAVIEQMSIYLVNRELDHRESTLQRQAEAS